MKETHKTIWPKYPKAIFPLAEEVDVAFVDGRFRVACIIATILKSRPDTIVLVHDFYPRPHYHLVLEYVDVVERTDTMVALRRKKTGVNDATLVDLFNKYQYIAP